METRNRLNFCEEGEFEMQKCKDKKDPNVAETDLLFKMKLKIRLCRLLKMVSCFFSKSKQII